IDAVRPSVVSITTLVNGRPFAGGTGWVLDSDQGLIVTNAHVINEATSIQVGVAGAPRETEIVGVAPCEDVAVLRVADHSGLRTIDLGSQGTLEQGEIVIALGFPANASGEDELTATTGIVSITKTKF